MKNNNKNVINVLKVGSHISVKGGISSVVKQFMNYKWDKDINIDYIPTYIESNKLSQIIYYIKSITKIINHMLFKEVDIIHIHMSHTGSFYRKYIILKIGKLFRKKVIIHLHGSEFKKFFDKTNNLSKKLIKNMLCTTDKILVLGENWNNIIKSIDQNAKTQILLNTVCIPKSIAIQEKEKVNILFLGALVVRKGIFELVEVVKNLKENNILNEYNVKFILGGTGKEENIIKEKINNYKLNNYIELAGWIDGRKKEELLKTCHCFVLPSHNEGLPVAILEAISYGLPVISTKVGSIDEAVINDYNGFLIEAENVKALENALTKIIKSHKLRSMLSENSRKLAIGKFNEEKYFGEIRNLYINI